MTQNSEQTQFGSIPTWNGQADSVDTFEDACRIYNRGTKKDDRIYVAARIIGRMDTSLPAYKACLKIEDKDLEVEDGYKAVLRCIRSVKGPKPMAEAVKLFKELVRGSEPIRRKN